MSKAKPTHMRPVLEDVVDAGVISPELRKAIRWSLVTIDDLTARLAAAEAEIQKSKCPMCGGLIIKIDAPLCSCNLPTVSAAIMPDWKDGCVSVDTLTMEKNDVQKNSGSGGEK